jgi:hypothetical protein
MNTDLETPSSPDSLAASRRGFAFHVAALNSSVHETAKHDLFSASDACGALRAKIAESARRVVLRPVDR